MEIISYLWQYIVEAFGLIIAYVFAAIFIFLMLRRAHSRKITVALVAIFIGVSIAFYVARSASSAPARFGAVFLRKKRRPSFSLTRSSARRRSGACAATRR